MNPNRTVALASSLVCAAFTVALATSALAQDGTIYPLDAPPEPNAIPLNTGGVEGQTAPESWFRQWGEARRAGDSKAEAEAEKAMATSKHWAILHEMAKDGAYPETVWELAREMPSGHWQWAGKRHPLLPRAEGLGCARWGIPALPWKQRRQNERRDQQTAEATTVTP